MNWLIGLITGLPGMLGKLFNYLTVRSNNAVVTHQTDVTGDTTVQVAEGQERVQTQQIVTEARAHDRESLWTAWMLPSAFGVSLSHYSATIFDSMTLFGHKVGAWGIAGLGKTDYAGTPAKIIMFCCGIAAANHAVKRFTK